MTPDVMEHRGDFRLYDALVDAIDAVMARGDDPRTYGDELLAAIPDNWTKLNGKWIEVERTIIDASGYRYLVLTPPGGAPIGDAPGEWQRGCGSRHGGPCPAEVI